MRLRTAAGDPPFSRSKPARLPRAPSMNSSALATAFGSASVSATSCPARAKLIAQLRPISPAPMTATLLISHLGGCATSQGLHIGADADRLAGDVGAARRYEEEHRRRDVARADHAAQRDLLEIAALHLLVADAELLGAGLDDALDARPLDDAGQDGIDPDIVGSELLGEALRQADDAPLRRGIRA